MKKNKKVLIIGITGQDGSYLANLLLKKKYKVFGLSRRNSSIENLKKLNIYTKIKLNKKKNLMLGNINIKRDWGWGPEYMSGCIKIMEKNYFDDFIIATGKTISLKKIVEYAFKRNKLNWKKYVKLSKKHKRKFDINENYADLSKIKKKINWQPKLTYKDIVNKI